MGLDDVVEVLAMSFDLFEGKWFWILVGVLLFLLLIGIIRIMV